MGYEFLVLPLREKRCIITKHTFAFFLEGIMKGSTHLAIGLAIGAAASAYYPLTAKNASIYLAVAAFSALSPDLDGTGMLSSKLGKLTKLLRELALWSGVLLIAAAAYFYFIHSLFYPNLTIVAVVVLLLGLVTK
jgi:inner membrane protein